MMGREELEFQSLLLYLKEGVLAKEFSIEVQNEPLNVESRQAPDGSIRNDVYRVDTEVGAYGSQPVSNGRGWLSFEPTTIPTCSIYDPTTSGYVSTRGTPFQGISLSIPVERETSLTIVKDQSGNVIPRDYYRIDYEKGRIRWPSATTPSGSLGNIPTEVDYCFHMVSLLDGYPTDEDMPELPLVTVFPTAGTSKGFQLGPGIKSKQSYTVQVFATSEVEKRNILNRLHKALINKHAPVVDFNRTGMPLEQWGAVNPNFIQDLNYQGDIYRSYLTLNPSNGQNLYFVDIEMLYNSSPRQVMSESLRHVGMIKFTTVTYTDRDPSLVGRFSGLNEPLGGFDSLIKKGYSE
jgi:hypothetical protein